MKRTCTEAEKKLLYNNKKQMLDGIYWTATKSTYSYVIVGLIISLIIGIAGAFLAADKFQVSEVGSHIWMLVCFGVSYIICFIIMSNLKVKREAKAFLKRKDLMINGATIVEVDEDGRFAYIEDEFRDEDGRPIIIDYPSDINGLTAEDVGKRILVIRDSESNFQLVRLNDELDGLISNYSADYPLTEELSEYTRVPHPNIINVDKTGHELSEDERASFADLYVKVVQGIAFNMVKIAGVVFVVCVGIICGLLNFVEDGYPLATTLPIGVAVCVGMAVLYWLMSLIGKVNIRRQGNFVHVKEVVFHSYVVGRNTAMVRVYEWVDGQVQLCEYFAGNVSTGTKYGSILYKFITPKGKEVLLNTSPVSKKRK